MVARPYSNLGDHKMVARPYSNLSERAEFLKQILGGDVIGSYPRSIEGFQFCLEVICYFSGKGWSISLKSKFYEYSEFEDLLVRMQNSDDPCFSTKVYNSDFGRDTIMSHKNQKFLKDHGIFYLSVPGRTPNLDALMD